MPALRPSGDWESCGTVHGAWVYTRRAAKPLNQLLPYMTTSWDMGGNVQMNVGPTLIPRIREFPPATARFFRFNILQSEKPPQIRGVELCPLP